MRRFAVLAVAALVALALALAVPSAGAASTTVTITVNTTETAFTSGDGLCSLAEAIAFTQGTSESDCSSASPTGNTTIDLPAGTYTIAGTILINNQVDIVGAGSGTTTLSGGGNYQVVDNSDFGNVSISGVTITGGVSGDPTFGCSGSGLLRSCPAEDGNSGGGILNGGNLTLSDDVISGNDASPGTAPFSGTHLLCTTNCPASVGDSAGDGGAGGGIYNDGSLTISGSTISANAAGNGGDGTDGSSGTGTDVSAGQNGGDGGAGGDGGGIYNEGTLMLTDSTLSANTGGSSGTPGNGSSATDANGNGGNGGNPGLSGVGAGIYNIGSLSISDSTISGNQGGDGSAASQGGSGSGTGSNGTGSGYTIGGDGGGIYDEGSPGTLTNVTIAGNTTSGMASGAGIFDEGVLLQLSFATIADNSASWAGGGIYNDAGSVEEADSIIGDNHWFAIADCANSGFVDEGGNVTYGDDSCPGRVADPKLVTLGNNGGPVPTIALGSGSAAIDLIPAAACGVATDERGVARPQGAACDAGAYEFAPPVVASVTAAATAADTAMLSAGINPNLTDTKVTVDYGPTTAYGNSTTSKDIGSGNAKTAFSATLSGLSPSTTYHAKIVATNTDGSTSSADLTFTTPATLTASTSSSTAVGSQLELSLTCNNVATPCSGTLNLTSHVTTRGTEVVGLAASAGAKKAKPKPKPKTTLKTVGSGSYTVAAGTTQTVTISLNATGRKLLNDRYRLPATLTMTGAIALSRQVVFAYGRIHAKLGVAWTHRRGSATPTRVSVSSLPARAGVTVICSGRGCPFAKRRYAPKGRSLNLSPPLAHHALGRGSVLTFEITAAGDVGQVVRYEIGSGGSPRLLNRCLVPGARAPSVCA